MSLSKFLSSFRPLALSTVRRLRHVPVRTRRAIVRADHGVQDHIVLATVLALSAILLITGTTLWYWGETIITMAKKYQPLFAIVWIVISAVLLVVSFFRTRRAARLGGTAPAPAVAVENVQAAVEALPTNTATAGGSHGT
ncbi:hypothetical protein ACFW9I_22780 [[Kitasatospora] papulosa]|uniref:hypothetical protein n=1 Tax=[Kitasatospora] papulosa TaxID=1464011 RepID=UPI003678BDBC